MKRRLWIVTELYWPDQTSTAYYLSGIAEGLAERMDVRVLCGFPPAETGLRPAADEVHQGVAIHRARALSLARRALPLRVLGALSVTLSIFAEALRRFRRDDLVLVVTNPPALPFAIALAARLRRSRWTLLVHDVYPEVLAVAGLLSSDSFLYGLLGRANRRLLLAADQVVVLGRDMRDLVAGRLPPRQPLITIIPNWADLEEVGDGDGGAGSLRDRLGIPRTAFVAGYSGNMGRTHDVGSIVEAAARLGPEAGFHFLLIGAGAEYRAVRQRLDRQPLPHVTLIPPLPRAELAAGLAAADVALISFRPGMRGVSVPSRMYNLLAAGRPVVAMCDGESELAKVVREEAVGWVLEPGDVDGLVRTLETARAGAAGLAGMRARARRAAESKYSRRAVIEAYRRLLGPEEVRPVDRGHVERGDVERVDDGGIAERGA